MTASAKEAFAFAFENIGGAAQLSSWAFDNQTEFYKLYAKLIPVTLSDPDGNNPFAGLMEAVAGEGRPRPGS